MQSLRLKNEVRLFRKAIQKTAVLFELKSDSLIQGKKSGGRTRVRSTDFIFQPFFFLSFDHNTLIAIFSDRPESYYSVCNFVSYIAKKSTKITDQETMHILTVMLSSFSLLETSVEVI